MRVFFFIIWFCVSSAVSSVPPQQILSLQRCIDLAIQFNHDVVKATRIHEEARAKLSSARSQYFPKVELRLDAGAYHDRIPQPGDSVVPLVPRDRSSYVALLNISQSLFSGLQRLSSVRRFEADEKVADLELDIQKQEAAEEIIRLYFGVQVLEYQIAAEREIKQLRETQLKEAQHRLEKGAATDLKQLQALYELKKQEPRIDELEGDLSSRRLKLYRRLNVELDGKYSLSDPLPVGSLNESFKLPPLSQAFEFALQNNFKIRKLNYAFQALQAESGESFAQHLPSLSLDLSAGTNSYMQQDIATPNSMAYGAQLRLRVPLFSGLDSFSDREMWRAKLDTLKEERSKYREILLDDLNDSYRRLEMYTRRIEASKTNVELTQRVVKQAQAAYQLGRTRLVDVLGAYSTSLEARRENIQDSFDRIATLFHVKTLLGIGNYQKGEE